MPNDQILRRIDVQKRTGLSRSTIYEQMTQGTFPLAIKLGARAVGWSEKEVSEWLEARKSERAS